MTRISLLFARLRKEPGRTKSEIKSISEVFFEIYFHSRQLP